jgi:phosphomannomutase
LISNLPDGANFKKLSLLPTCGTKFYRYNSGWEQLYSEDFTDQEKEKVISSLQKAIRLSDVNVEVVSGELIEDRGSQITFSALGQRAPLDEKKKWDPDFTKRRQMKAFLDDLIPEFSVRLGGTTSIDVTRQGIDKGHGIRKTPGHSWRCD